MEAISFAAGKRIVLIHNELPSSDRVDYIGAICMGPSDQTPPAFAPYTSEKLLSTSYMYASSASLDGLNSAQVFRDGGDCCRGILLKYRNGGERAIGQCRVGVDAIEECISPSHICWRTYTSSQNGRWGLQCLKVELVSKSTHTHGDVEWQCHEAKGMIHFSFSERSSDLFLVSEV